MATDKDIAWLAGLFEGEGYISLLPKQGIRVGINMTDRDVVERVHTLFGGRFEGPISRGGWKDDWRWIVTRWDQGIPLLLLIKPYMGIRRTAKIEEAIAVYRSNGGRRRRLYKPCDHDLGVSNAGYIWHQRHHLLPACDKCMASYQLYMQQYRADPSFKQRRRRYDVTYRGKQEGRSSETQ